MGVADLRTKHFDTENIQGLTAYILSTHVDDTFHAKSRTDSSCCNTMLSSASLSDNARFPNPASKQDLPYSIIDLMRPCVVTKAVY
jgi:hypothetical protein